MVEGFPFGIAGESADIQPYPKADILERFIAKFIDFLIVGALFAFPTFIGVLAGLTYILISDGLKEGQSIGKRVIGLRVVAAFTGRSADFKQSIIRNAPFGIAIIWYLIIGWIPYLGKILAFAGVAAIIGMEMVLVYTDELGNRFGDRIAHTQVIQGKFVKIP